MNLALRVQNDILNARLKELHLKLEKKQSEVVSKLMQTDPIPKDAVPLPPRDSDKLVTCRLVDYPNSDTMSDQGSNFPLQHGNPSDQEYEDCWMTEGAGCMQEELKTTGANKKEGSCQRRKLKKRKQRHQYSGTVKKILRVVDSSQSISSSAANIMADLIGDHIDKICDEARTLTTGPITSRDIR